MPRGSHEPPVLGKPLQVLLDGFEQLKHAQFTTSGAVPAGGPSLLQAADQLRRIVDDQSRVLTAALAAALPTAGEACAELLALLAAVAAAGDAGWDWVQGAWLAAAGGAAGDGRDAGTEVLLQVLAARPADQELARRAAELVSSLGGIAGLLQLLGRVQGLPHAEEQVVWALIEAYRHQFSRHWVDQEVEQTMALAVQATLSEKATLPLQRACLVLMKDLVVDWPIRGTLWQRSRGDDAAVHALRCAGRQPEGCDNAAAVIAAAAELLACAVKGNDEVSRRLRALGAPELLLQCVRDLNGNFFRTYVDALGQVGGPRFLLQLAAQGSQPPERVRETLRILDRLTWDEEAMAEVFADQRLPTLTWLVQALPVVNGSQVSSVPLTDFLQADRSSLCEYLGAVGGIVGSLAKQHDPGEVPVLDKGMEIMLFALHGEKDAQVGERIACCLGTIAERCDRWVPAMASAVESVRRRLQNPAEGEERLKHQETYLWVVAVLGGVHLVVAEMKARPHSTNFQEAAMKALRTLLCNHANNLDYNLEDCLALSADADSLSQQRMRVQEVLEVVIGSMNCHLERRPLQEAGCNALGLLYMNLPTATIQLLHQASAAVIAALNRHQQDSQVVAMAVWALQAFLERPCGLPQAKGYACVLAAAAHLKQQGLQIVLQHVLKNFSHGRTPSQVFFIWTFVFGLGDMLGRFDAWHGGDLESVGQGLDAWTKIARTVPYFFKGACPNCHAPLPRPLDAATAGPCPCGYQPDQTLKQEWEAFTRLGTFLRTAESDPRMQDDEFQQKITLLSGLIL